MKKTLFTSLVLLLFFSFNVFSQHAQEKFYQTYFAKWLNCQSEVILPDRSRCDILCATYAIEVDFAPKWAESIGQSLYYSHVTGKLPGIVIIKSRATDSTYISRLYSVTRVLDIKVWVIGSASLRIYSLP